jgi:hypothetical protein
MRADSSSPRPRSIRKVVVAGLIGTSLEWYDFFLHGSAAAVVPTSCSSPRPTPLPACGSA